MCTPNFQEMQKAASDFNNASLDRYGSPGPARSFRIDTPATPLQPKPYVPSPLEQAAKQYGFKEVTAPLLVAPARPPKQVAQIVNNSAFDTKYIVGADGVSRQAKTGLASLRIDRTGANT